MPNVGIDGRYCVLARASKSSSKYRPFGNAASCQHRPCLVQAEYSMARTCLRSYIVNGLRDEYLKFLLYFKWFVSAFRESSDESVSQFYCADTSIITYFFEVAEICNAGRRCKLYLAKSRLAKDLDAFYFLAFQGEDTF